MGARKEREGKKKPIKEKMAKRGKKKEKEENKSE